MLRGLLRRFRSAPPPSAPEPQPHPHNQDPRPGSALLVDASTWTFWSRGASAAETLVETTGTPVHRTETVSRKVAAMVEARHRTPKAQQDRGDPAAAEMLFVELMRAGSFERAYRLLAPECQQRWGSPEKFAGAQQGTGHDAVARVEVKRVAHLEVWPDPDSGRVNRDVAELTVEYVIDAGEQQVAIERVVHLVAVDGRWRSLCYPPRAASEALPA